jgi:hypothetical protein
MTTRPRHSRFTGRGAKQKDAPRIRYFVEETPGGVIREVHARDSRGRKVRRDYVGDVYVSTVFAGEDPTGSEPPRPFETIVFGAHGIEKASQRYATRDEAIAGHERFVALLTQQRGRR